jgi:hypothetical protein
VELQATGRSRHVDGLPEGDKSDAERLEVVKQRDEVSQVPSESVEAPAHQHIEPTTFGVKDRIVTLLHFRTI